LEIPSAAAGENPIRAGPGRGFGGRTDRSTLPGAAAARTDASMAFVRRRENKRKKRRRRRERKGGRRRRR
jgi:hypothetical protein